MGWDVVEGIAVVQDVVKRQDFVKTLMKFRVL
jgi:hypothetical protein